MSYKVIYPRCYIRRASAFARKHPELIKQYEKTLKMLELNPFHQALRLHPLKGKLKGLHSVSINISYRITLELIIHEESIVLINVGTHGDVY